MFLSEHDHIFSQMAAERDVEADAREIEQERTEVTDADLMFAPERKPRRGEK